MALGTIATLDLVLQISDNLTNEQLIIEKTALDAFILRSGVTPNPSSMEMGCDGNKTTGNVSIEVESGIFRIINTQGALTFGLGLGCCSGAAFFFDIQGDGGFDAIAEYSLLTDGGFSTYATKHLYQISSNLRTAGDVVNIVGDKGSLTTGRILAVTNDGSGTIGGPTVFAIDKHGKISISDTTRAKTAFIERTLTEFILDSGTEVMNIKSAGVSILVDNGVSELAIGHTTLAPKIPVMTTAQRNALTATQGMIIYHVGPPLTAQIYTGAAWVNL